jgi:hypothetical protein
MAGHLDNCRDLLCVVIARTEDPASLKPENRMLLIRALQELDDFRYGPRRLPAVKQTRCPPHLESVPTRDGKECKKCGLGWRFALKENRQIISGKRK